MQKAVRLLVTCSMLVNALLVSQPLWATDDEGPGLAMAARVLSPRVSLTNPTIELLATSPFSGSLVFFRTSDFTETRRTFPILAGYTITGMQAITRNPANGLFYVIVRVSVNSNSRLLATIDPATAVCTLIGNLGDRFSSITFTEGGTCFGMTGNGATVSETLYKINTSTAAKTLIRPLPNGADGDVIAYNKDDGFIYHWSGGTTVFEKVDTLGTTVTNIPITGGSNREIFGAVYDGDGVFITSDISSQFETFTTEGVRSSPFGTAPDDMRGLAFLLPPPVLTCIPPTPSVATQSTPNGLVVQVSGGVQYERLKMVDRINGYQIRQTEQNQTGYFVITQPGPYSIAVIGANGCRANVMGTL